MFLHRGWLRHCWRAPLTESLLFSLPSPHSSPRHKGKYIKVPLPHGYPCPTLHKHLETPASPSPFCFKFLIIKVGIKTGPAVNTYVRGSLSSVSHEEGACGIRGEWWPQIMPCEEGALVL